MNGILVQVGVAKTRKAKKKKELRLLMSRWTKLKSFVVDIMYLCRTNTNLEVWEEKKYEGNFPTIYY